MVRIWFDREILRHIEKVSVKSQQQEFVNFSNIPSHHYFYTNSLEASFFFPSSKRFSILSVLRIVYLFGDEFRG